MKTCTKCKQAKPFRDFYTRGEGYYPVCKVCHRAAMCEARAKAPPRAVVPTAAEDEEGAALSKLALFNKLMSKVPL